jgi:hypothetical protein
MIDNCGIVIVTFTLPERSDVQLVGKSRVNLKVKNAAALGFNPREVLLEMITVYNNLGALLCTHATFYIIMFWSCAQLTRARAAAPPSCCPL